MMNQSTTPEVAMTYHSSMEGESRLQDGNMTGFSTVLPFSNPPSSGGDYDPRCGEMTERYLEIWGAMQWWCEGILFTAFGIIGLIGNLLSILVLATKDVRKHTFNQLLIALAAFDILFIVVSVPVYSFQMFGILIGSQLFSQLYVNFLYPMSPVALCASVYMTLAITVERYLAVCKPILYRNLNMTMSSSKRVAMYVAPVALISVCLNIPKFMETQTTQTGNSTEIEATEMRLNPTYMLYYTISQIFHPTLTTGILPMAILIYMNTSIFLGIRKQMANRNRMRHGLNNRNGQTQTTSNNNNNLLSANNGPGGRDNLAASSSRLASPCNNPGRRRHGGPSSNQGSSGSNENNLAVVLIGIVIMHIICHTLRVFLAGMAVHLIRDTMFCMETQGGFVPPLWTMVGETVSSLLIMINFSGNFLIFCSVLKPFKKKISKWFAPGCAYLRSKITGMCRKKEPGSGDNTGNRLLGGNNDEENNLVIIVEPDNNKDGKKGISIEGEVTQLATTQTNLSSSISPSVAANNNPPSSTPKFCKLILRSSSKKGGKEEYQLYDKSNGNGNNHVVEKENHVVEKEAANHVGISKAESLKCAAHQSSQQISPSHSQKRNSSPMIGLTTERKRRMMACPRERSRVTAELFQSDSKQQLLEKPGAKTNKENLSENGSPVKIIENMNGDQGWVIEA